MEFGIDQALASKRAIPPLTLRVVEAPTAGASPFPPVWLRSMGTGLAGGLMIGLFAGFLRRVAKTT